MSAVSLAIVDKDNRPLYLREFVREPEALEDEVVLFDLPLEIQRSTSSLDCSLKQEFILHAALDRFVDLAGPPPGHGWRNRPGSDGMFVGLLCPVDELRVYGYCTTTKVKFFLVVEDEALSPSQQVNADVEIKTLLKSIHEFYVQDMLNPFKELEESIASKRFDKQVQDCVAAFNQSEGMI